MADLYPYQNSLVTPARRHLVVVPSDTQAFLHEAKALYVGTGGTLVLRAADDTQDIAYKNVPSGSYIDARVVKVLATGTTATDILALY